MKNPFDLTEELMERYQHWYRSFQPRNLNGQTISEVTSLYEQKHLLRKDAILEILEEKLIINKENEIAEALIKKLIKNNHLPDHSFQSKIEEVQNKIDKYVFIVGHASEGEGGKSKKQLQKWLLNVIAWEIEDTLMPKKKKFIREFMNQVMEEKIKAPSGLTNEEKELQTYIACHKSLLNPDKSLLTYCLLLKKFPYWKDPTQEQLIDLTVSIYSIWKDIRRNLSHSLQSKFYEICRKFTPIFLLLRELSEETDLKNIKNPEWLEGKINQIYQRNINELKKGLLRTTFLSLAVVFFLKTFLLLIIEIPLTNFPLSLSALTVNVLGPPSLLLFLTLTVKLPQDKNLHLIKLEAAKILYGQHDQDNYPVKKEILGQKLLFWFHLSTFLIFSGLITLGLRLLNFPLLSQLIFIGFVSLISFIIVQMQNKVSEWEITEKENSLLQDIMESFALPLIKVKNIMTNTLTATFLSKTKLLFETFQNLFHSQQHSSIKKL